MNNSFVQMQRDLALIGNYMEHVHTFTSNIYYDFSVYAVFNTFDTLVEFRVFRDDRVGPKKYDETIPYDRAIDRLERGWSSIFAAEY